MHESSLARKILEAVLEGAAKANASRVRVVRGSVAEAERLSSESISLHFRALAWGTVAEDAVLELSVHHLEARCLTCGAKYLPQHHLLACPHCASVDGELVGLAGVWIDTLDVEG